MRNRINAAPVLIADDDVDDRNLLMKALKECNFNNEVVFVEDGQQVMDYLLSRNVHSGSGKDALPAFILLDLNMPCKDGRQVLKEIKEHPELKIIPVIVFTTSKASNDITSTYEAGGNCYIIKPSTYNELLDVIRTIDSFWFETAVLPSDKVLARKHAV